MPGLVGTSPYQSKVATLSDAASIEEAFKYYHTGDLTGSIQPNSIQYHLQSINDRADTLNTQIGYTGISPAPASVHARLSSLETTVGTQGLNLPSTYIKMSPSSNDNNSTRNYIVPLTNDIIPMTIQGIAGQSVDLQQWKVDTTIVSKIDKNGKFYSYDGSSTAEVATLTGTQTLTNKTLINPISTIATNVKTASYTLALSDQSKIIEINSSSATIVTIPADTSINFPIGTYIIVMQTGTGQVTIAGNTFTPNATPGLKLRTQWAMATLIKRGTNSWVVSGDLVA